MNWETLKTSVQNIDSIYNVNIFCMNKTTTESDKRQEVLWYSTIKAKGFVYFWSPSDITLECSFEYRIWCSSLVCNHFSRICFVSPLIIKFVYLGRQESSITDLVSCNIFWEPLNRNAQKKKEIIIQTLRQFVWINQILILIC